jgi:diguanylate cyclase (GGDEF)-like protein/PAS domain S-box-containing protein
MASIVRMADTLHCASRIEFDGGKSMSTFFSAEAWRDVVANAPDGIVICDAVSPDHPVIYVNAAFTQLCGYPASALLGSNLRMLQGTDRDQESRQRLREALQRGEACRILIRNYRPDGALFWNETSLQPVRDAKGKLTHWIGYHRDAGGRLKVAERTGTTTVGLAPWLREDRMTGLHSRVYFEDLLNRDWQLAQRDSHEIGLVLYDIDNLGTYNEAFDKAGGDACIRRAARVIAGSYRRGSDLVGRWEGGTFAVLTQGDAADRAVHYAGVVAQRVRDLLIHHPRGTTERYVTMSAGVASLVPPRELALEALLNACRTALKRAKAQGRNQVAIAEATDFK